MPTGSTLELHLTNLLLRRQVAACCVAEWQYFGEDATPKLHLTHRGLHYDTLVEASSLPRLLDEEDDKRNIKGVGLGGSPLDVSLEVNNDSPQIAREEPSAQRRVWHNGVYGRTLEPHIAAAPSHPCVLWGTPQRVAMLRRRRGAEAIPYPS